MREIDEIIIHCSDSDVASHDNIETIGEWHKQRGFSQVGYHFYINKKGDIELGRSVGIAGAHCKGHNANSIGICVGGRSWFNTKQGSTLSLLVKILRHSFPNIDKVSPHYKYNPEKTCPNFKHELFGDYDE